MVLRLLFLSGAVLVLFVGWRMWRRAPAGLSWLDLTDLGVPGPAIVQFGTKLCAPCRASAPRLEEAAGRAGLAYAQVDLDDRPDVARRYGIRTVPTIIVAGPGGEVLEAWTSVPEPARLEEAALRAAV